MGIGIGITGWQRFAMWAVRGLALTGAVVIAWSLFRIVPQLIEWWGAL